MKHRSFAAAVLIVSIILTAFLAQVASTAYIGNVSSYVDKSSRYPYSYVVERTNSTFYQMTNGTSGKVDYLSTNFTKVWNYAGGNLTGSGGTVMVKSGTYTQGGGYNWLRTKVTYQGEGFGTRINLVVSDAEDSPIKNWNCQYTNPTLAQTDYNITVKGMRFVGTGASYPAKAKIIILKSAKYCVIEDNVFENCLESTGNWGINLDGGTTAHTKACTSFNTIRNNKFFHFSYDPIIIGDTVSPYGNGTTCNTVTGNYIEDCQVGISLYDAHYTTISYNTVVNATRMTAGGSPAGAWIHGCSVANKITDNTFWLVQTGVGGNVVEDYEPCDNIISNNVIRLVVPVGENWYHGISAWENYIVTGNTLFSPYEDDLAPAAGGGIHSGIGIERANVLVQGNTIVGNNWNEGGIRASSKGAKIFDNIFNSTESGNNPIIVTDTAINTTIRGNTIQGAGIVVDAGAQDTLIECNFVLDGNSLIDSDAGTGTVIRWNPGYKTEGSGNLVSCLNGTLIPHGLVATPAFCPAPCLLGSLMYNTTILLMAPTITSMDATDMHIEFLMWRTTDWVIFPVTAVEAQTVYWQAQTWNYP